jgi:prepilin-type N-terminal cleavage/methylation domain-containing protein
MTRRAPEAFTLLEMLAAMAVLAVLVVMVAQVLNLVTTSVSRSEKKSTAEIEAQNFFSRIGADLRQAVIRRDLDLSAFKHDGFQAPQEFGGASFSASPQAGNDQLAFCAQTPGSTPGSVEGTKRSSFAAVGYFFAPEDGEPRLQRAAQGLAWERESTVGALAYLPATLATAFPNLFTDPALARTVAEDVFRFEISYLLRSRPSGANPFAITPWDGSLPADERWPNGFADVYAIVVTVAVLDGRNRQIAGDLAPVANLLPDAKDAEDPAPVWRAIIDAPDFPTRSGLPAAAAAGVRVYQHTFPISPP